MRSKKLLVIGITLMLSVGAINTVYAEKSDEVTLTEAQVEEMKILQQQALENEISIISKYVEYGVFSKEKGDKIIQHIEERYQTLEENNFIPKWDRKHHKKRDN
ncbi:DUF2680 domain-containing protein [Gracilibacillus kekensis]|uniref:DUF2680 domain-containing protein n=1 Tax=Gracilibacillus kekensis TaxID=1027249 RepID=A0A1M7PMI7_9BACI|nr:DUF2680 domain-containing protein [Gracilibacillus kekensis]SHN18443.1 Protein of unknown function [Gracilibacillus kekensis]